MWVIEVLFEDWGRRWQKGRGLAFISKTGQTGAVQCSVRILSIDLQTREVWNPGDGICGAVR